MGANGAQATIHALLAQAGVTINGDNAWDIRVHNKDLYSRLLSGGVLALGCTIGQGITGISTLALGSFIAFGGIVLGSALTMKIQYYKMVYEDEASFGAALVTSLVDMHLLPKALRRLESV